MAETKKARQRQSETETERGECKNAPLRSSLGYCCRFLEENRAELDPLLAELPFGYGPRQCIGMRLALLEIKFAAVRHFRTFRFLKCPDTPVSSTLNLLHK